jgi:hypothetical protein
VAYYDPYVPVIRPTREHPHWAGTRSVNWDRETRGGFRRGDHRHQPSGGQLSGTGRLVAVHRGHAQRAGWRENQTGPGLEGFGAVTTRQVIELIQRILKPNRRFEFWKEDAEFYLHGGQGAAFQLCSGCFKIAGHRRENPAGGKGFGRFSASLDRGGRRIGLSLNLSLFSRLEYKRRRPAP